jgi:selenocysteine-specific elongation factor
VVTGTVFDGVVDVGDRLVLSPSGRELRVRAIEQNGRRCERATAGSRCGLNLAGVEVGEVSRGQWVLAPHLHNPSTRLDIQLTPSPGSSSALRHGSEVQVHLGAGHLTGRVNLSGRGSLEPGSSGFAQLVLSAPVSCVHGDRFIVRDPCALRTLGGGVVLDPLPPRRQSSALRAQRLQALSAGTAQAVLSALELASPPGVDLDAFSRAFNLSVDRLQELCQVAEIARLGKNPTVGLSTRRVQQLRDAILEALRAFHGSSPGAEGMALGSLRTRAAPAVSSETFQAILRELVRLQRVALTGTQARLLDHEVQDSPAERTAWERASPALANAGLQGLTLAELASVTRVAPALLAVTLARKVRLGLLVRVDEERYCLRGTVDTLAQTLRQMARSLPQGRFTAAQARDHTRLGRQLLIQRMEAMDRLGITRRLGETRVFCDGSETGRSLH